MLSLQPHTAGQFLKRKAQELGFMSCGISKAEFLEKEARQLDDWLGKGYHGHMDYMARHFDMRLDPRLLVPGAKSVISLLYNYFPETTAASSELKISKYAYGEDYHYVVKDKLRQLFEALKAEVGDVEGRVFVDSAPVMERSWAARAGLGWQGKHSLLINQSAGSFFFLAEMIVDLELVADGPVPDRCGTCTRCMDACPTEAIPEPYTVDGSRCISYLTIELKEAIPEEFKRKMENWMFGCDICQDVCPWNRFSKPHAEPRFLMSAALAGMTAPEWEHLTEESFRKLFKNSPVKRTKYSGLMRNIRFTSAK